MCSFAPYWVGPHRFHNTGSTLCYRSNTLTVAWYFTYLLMVGCFLVYFVECFLNGGTLEMLPPMTRFTLDLKHKQRIMYMYMYIFKKNICWFINKFLQSKHFQFSEQSGQKLYSYLPMVGGSLRVLWLLPPLKLVAMISLKYIWCAWSSSTRVRYCRHFASVICNLLHLNFSETTWSIEFGRNMKFAAGRFTLDLKHKQKIMYMYIFSKNICWFINKFLQSKHFQFSEQSGQKLYSYFPWCKPGRLSLHLWHLFI
jgi:hypothetical protein